MLVFKSDNSALEYFEDYQASEDEPTDEAKKAIEANGIDEYGDNAFTNSQQRYWNQRQRDKVDSNGRGGLTDYHIHRTLQGLRANDLQRPVTREEFRAQVQRLRKEATGKNI
jgi:hypothetical protein